MAETNVMRTGDGIVLTPDPSALTRESIDRDVAAIRELLLTYMKGEVGTIQARLDAMDEAVRLFKSDLTRVPTDVDKQVGNLDKLTTEKFHTVDQRFAAVEQRFHERDLRFAQATNDTQHALSIALESTEKVIDQRFHGVDTQFIERDVRVKESATATATAVAAALQAAKEAVGEQNKSFTVSIDKSEKATGDQITQNRAILDTTTRGLNDKIDDLKERLTRIEGLGIGKTSAVTEGRASSAEMRGYLSVGISLILVAIAIATLALRVH